MRASSAAPALALGAAQLAVANMDDSDVNARIATCITGQQRTLLSAHVRESYYTMLADPHVTAGHSFDTFLSVVGQWRQMQRGQLEATRANITAAYRPLGLSLLQEQSLAELSSGRCDIMDARFRDRYDSLRQWAAIRDCYRLVEAEEAKRHVRYTLLYRTRTDLVFLAPTPLAGTDARSQEHVYTSLAGMSSGYRSAGMNDMLFVCPRLLCRPYFTLLELWESPHCVPATREDTTPRLSLSLRNHSKLPRTPIFAETGEEGHGPIVPRGLAGPPVEPFWLPPLPSKFTSSWYALARYSDGWPCAYDRYAALAHNAKCGGLIRELLWPYAIARLKRLDCDWRLSQARPPYTRTLKEFVAPCLEYARQWGDGVPQLTYGSLPTAARTKLRTRRGPFPMTCALTLPKRRPPCCRRSITVCAAHPDLVKSLLGSSTTKRLNDEVRPQSVTKRGLRDRRLSQLVSERERAGPSIALVVPVHAPKFLFARRLAHSLLWCGQAEAFIFAPTFASEAERNAFDITTNGTLLTLGQLHQVRLLVPSDSRNPPTAKKLRGVAAAFKLLPQLTHALAIDADAQFQSRHDFGSHFAEWSRRRTTVGWPYGYNAYYGMYRNIMNASCAAAGYPISLFYLWWQDAPIYERADFYDFYDHFDWRRLSFLVYDYAAYMCFKVQRQGGWAVLNTTRWAPARGLVRSSGLEFASIALQDRISATGEYQFLSSAHASEKRLLRLHVDRTRGFSRSIEAERPGLLLNESTCSGKPAW